MQSYKAEQDNKLKNQEDRESGGISKKVQERRLKLYGVMMRTEEYYVRRRALGKEEQGRRWRGKPKIKWLYSARDDIREKGLSVSDWATWRHHNFSVLPLCSGDCRCATELHGGVVVPPCSSVAHRQSPEHSGRTPTLWCLHVAQSHTDSPFSLISSLALSSHSGRTPTLWCLHVAQSHTDSPQSTVVEH